MLSLSLLALCVLPDLAAAQSQYAAIPRWGQAVALVENTLYIQGGRTDPYNMYSYSSAPPNNDLLSLSLASSFNPSSPSFDYIGGCSNCSASQGPAVAWHTLTPFNTSGLLLFGGDPGPNSNAVLPDANDSAVLLDISNKADPMWDFETDSWANEPMRRIYHSAVSAAGKIWIVGGEKADHSGSAFSQHFIFDPSGPSFSPLPSTNGPADITGHQAVVLHDGRMLVFGGYSPSEKSLIPLSTIWALDTTQPDSPSWTTLSVSSSTVPPPRRNFAATLVDSGKILIHGGADPELQNSFADGWLLDTTQSPAVWSNVSALSQLGPRRDHFAVGAGTLAIFGFGYAQNGPAAAALEVFDISSGTFQTTYTPPAAVTSPTVATLPGSAPTGSSNPEGTDQPGSAEYPAPTGGRTPPGSGHGNGTGNGNGDGTPDPNHSSSTSHATAIALGTTFGVLALLVGAIGASYYARRRQANQSFHLLEDSADEESPHGDRPIPIAGMAAAREKGLPRTPVVRTVRERLSRVVPGISLPQDHQERRDILADEDTREFETNGWYEIRRDPSGSESSWTSRRRPTLGRMYDSLASLRSVGGAMLDYAAGAAAAGARGIKSREASTTSQATTLDDVIWNEKRASYNPYADEYGMDKYPAPSLTASRPRGGRQASSYTYVDPFQDYDVESLNYDPDTVYRDDDDDLKGYPSLHDPPPLPKIQTMRPPATTDLTRLTPVSEHSVPTGTDPSSHSNTSLAIPVPRSPIVTSSSSSHEPSQSPRRPSSILDANPPAGYVRRSDSWWTRFAKAPLLDRRLSGASRARSPRPFEFRDPHPPPRLVPIEESGHSTSPDSPQSHHRKRGSGESGGAGGHAQRFSTHHHARSASSLQTARTADTEQLERMASTMQIIQKDRTTSSSHRSYPSRASSGGTSVSTEFGDLAPQRPQPAHEGSSSSSSPPPLPTILGSQTDLPSSGLVLSPTGMHHDDDDEPTTTFALPDLPPPVRPSPPERRSSGSGGSKVSERVQAYERRMSQQLESMSPPKRSPPPVPARNRHTSTYGLAPRQPLFVANPDHGKTGSGDS